MPTGQAELRKAQKEASQQAHYAAQLQRQAQEWESLSRRHAAELAAVEEVKTAARREAEHALRTVQGQLAHSEAAREEAELRVGKLRQQLLAHGPKPRVRGGGRRPDRIDRQRRHGLS